MNADVSGTAQPIAIGVLPAIIAIVVMPRIGLAAFLPAYRAARVNPLTALRDE